jgi:hypothetical protein
VAARGAHGGSQLTDSQSVDSLERARQRRNARIGRTGESEDVLGRLAEFTEGIDTAFDWTDSAGVGGKHLQDRRDHAEIDTLEIRVEQLEEELEASRAQNVLEEERMGLENLDAARRSLIDLILGLLRIARSAILLLLLIWIFIRLLSMSGASAVYLPPLKPLIDQLGSS